MKQYLGVDIGGTAVKIGLVNEQGDILATHNRNVAFDQYETPIIETVKQAIDEFLNRENLSTSSLAGIGVSATGQIDYRKGIVIGVGGNIENWCGTHIKAHLEERYHLDTTVVNDANCMVIGEKWIGRAKGYQNVIGITIGTGVGGGIIVNDEILQGSKGIAGEIGHFSIDRGARKCACGNIGCYEQYASMTALIKDVKAKYELLDLTVDKERINGKVIFDALEMGNEVIQEIVQEWIGYIAQGLVSLIHLFNPEIILIGGGVCTQEERFIQPIRSYVLSHVMEQFANDLQIEAAILGNNAGLVGAVCYHLQHQ